MSKLSKAGRPSKLTREVQDKITDILKVGNYVETAAAYAGINKATLYDWLRRGERERKSIDAGNEPTKKELRYVRFACAVERAFAEAEMLDVKRVTDAGKYDWKAAAWRLERKWGRRKALQEQEEEHNLKLRLLEQEIEKNQLELSNLRGESEDDPHAQGSSYEDALNAQVADVFREELEAAEEEDGTDEETDEVN